MAELADILKVCVDQGASDILIVPGEPPVARLHGDLIKLGNVQLPSAAECRRWIYSILTENQKKEFEAKNELDCAYALPGVSRFRVNVFVQSQGPAAALRVITTKIPTPDEIALTPAIRKLAATPRGLVLVTGPTGSGKTTTLACLIEMINQTQAKHILTIEDPIEFMYKNKNSIIEQREVGMHTSSFKIALKYALRQNPDIILIGEMRDNETMSLALTAAETGHLCFSTLHTQDAPSTISRIIDEFPGDQQTKVRGQLASSLQAVVSQVLLPKKGGRGRVCAREVMVMNPGIGSLIREGKTHHLYTSIESGGNQGMISLDQHLAKLINENQITSEEAFKKCHDAESLKKLIAIHGGGTAAASNDILGVQSPQVLSGPR